MDTYFRGFMEGALLTASWVERLQGELGLKGVSQVWGERPAWYLWLADSPGAYRLCLEGAHPVESGGLELARGLFTIKYYPHPSDPFFNGFSDEERDLIPSPHFDQSVTPVFESQDAIAPHLFMAAALEIMVDPENNWAIFTLEGLDACRTRARDAAGGLLRDVPGWELAHGLYHRLLGMYAFYAKQPPARAQMTSSPGFEQVQAGSEVAAGPAPDVQLNTLSVLFCPDPSQPPPAAGALLDNESAQIDARLLFDLSFSCGRFHGPYHDREGGEWLNEDWWRLAEADYKSELASSCGCEH